MADPTPPGPRSIERTVAAWQSISERLAADKSLSTDEQAIVDMMGADPSIASPEALLSRFIAAIAFAEARAEEAKSFADGMRRRQARYDRRADLMRTALRDVMLALDRRNFSGSPFGTAYIMEGKRSAVITDEGLIPDAFWRGERRLLRADVTKALQVGEVPGAVLSNPMPTLVLRIERAGAASEDAETGEV